MSRVWITEKPSAAADLVAGMRLAFGLDVSNQPAQDGFTLLSNGDKVLPLAGHLLTTAPVGDHLAPEHARIEAAREYDRFQEFLPMLPPALKSMPRSDDAKGSKGGGKTGGKSKFARLTMANPGRPIRAYQIACKVLCARDVRAIVNAGDTDREGQLIVDELLLHLGIDPSAAHVARIELVSNRADDIARKLLEPLERNGDLKWRRRYHAAVLRQEFDYVYGLNLSIAYQARYRRSNISVGRVQTPVLNLVAERDQTIANFRPTDYFVPVITLQDGTELRWHRREGCEGQPGFDLQGRIVSRDLAHQITQAILGGRRGEVLEAKSVDVRERPPLPHSLGTLQAQASREHGMTVSDVTEAAQNLYKQKAISYVGTDCRFLPTSLLQDAQARMRQLATLFPKHAQSAHMSLVSPAWNDDKLDEHYAIIPMGLPRQGAPRAEMDVYRTIARRFIAQFHPDHVSRRHSLVARFDSDEFRATSRQILQPGWRDVEGDAQSESKSSDADQGEQPSDHPRDSQWGG